MASKLLILLFSSVLLGQCCQRIESKALDKTNDDSNSSAETEEWPSDLFNWSEVRKMPAVNQMQISVIHTSIPLLNFTLTQGAKLFEDVLRDIAAQKTTPTDSLQKKLAKLSEFVNFREQFKQNKHVDQTLDLHEVAAYFKNILSQYDTTKLEQPTAEELLIGDTLKKHRQPFVSGFDRVYLEIAPKIFKRADKYFDSLSAEGRQKVAILLRRYEALKGASDADTRRQCFEEFIFTK